MKAFLVILCLVILIFISHIIYCITQYVLFQKLNVGDAVWTESYKEAGVIIPIRIIKIDRNESGKNICIYLANEKSLTYKELRKSEYMI